MRAYVEDKVRDYRGERFQGDPPATVANEQWMDAPPSREEPRIFRDAVDITPSHEPDPNLAVDRLITVRLVPGQRKRVTVVLRGACVGIMANTAESTTCIDADRKRVPTPEELGESDLSTPTHSDFVGTFGRVDPPTGNPKPETHGTHGESLHDEEVAIQGGIVVADSAFPIANDAWLLFDHKVALVPSFFLDRYEVTVARWREAVSRGFQPKKGPIANNGLVRYSFNPDESCTYSDEPIAGSDSREEFPITCVTQEDARAFCQYMGRDLPTHVRWSYAALAAGRDVQTVYPWPDDYLPTCSDAVFNRLSDPTSPPDNESLPDCATELGHYGPGAVIEGPKDVTPGSNGVRGVAGSVQEWVLDSHPFIAACWARHSVFDPSCIDPQSKEVIVQGGSWADIIATPIPTTATRTDRTATIGFRCARTP